MDRCDNCFRLGMELAEAKMKIAILESNLRNLTDERSDTEKDQIPSE